MSLECKHVVWGRIFLEEFLEELLKSSMEETENLPTSLKCRHVVSGKRLLEEFLEGAAEIFHWRIRKPSDVIGLFRPGFLKVCLSLIQFYLLPCMSYPEKCKILLQEKQKSSCATEFFFPCFAKVCFYWIWVYPLLRMYYPEIYWLIPLKKQRIFHFHWIPHAREKKTNNDNADFVCSLWTEEERLYDGILQNMTS